MRSTTQKTDSFNNLPSFYARLTELETLAVPTLQFMILTAARLTETLSFRLNELDPQSQVWTIPADRSKTGQAHRVPLPTQAVALVNALTKQPISLDAYVFMPDRRRSVYEIQLTTSLKRIAPEIRIHDFRVMFKDWAAQHCTEPEIKHCLGLPDLQRSDILERRESIMQDWADYVTQ